MELVWPAGQYLPGYIHALEQAWSPDTLRPEAAQEQLQLIAEDKARFLSEQVDREAKGRPITLPNGSIVRRLPGFRMWIWDGEFCGAIGFRWQPGTPELPLHCLGHIGYTVVPWKRRRGYATRALGLMLPLARAEGLPYVELTTVTHNIASQRVIEANGGKLVERFRREDVHDGEETLRYRIAIGAR